MDKDVQIRQLRAQLDLAIKQRDGFMDNYHAVLKVPFQERRETIEECNTELEKIEESINVDSNPSI